MNRRVCESHLPNVREIAEIGNGLWLIEDGGRYGLMAPQGCSLEDVIFWFPTKPEPDDDPECKRPEDMRWEEKCAVLDERLTMHAQTGWYLIECCTEAGWRTNRQKECGYGGCMFSMWLMHYCGKLIQAWEAKT